MFIKLFFLLLAPGGLVPPERKFSGYGVSNHKTASPAGQAGRGRTVTNETSCLSHQVFQGLEKHGSLFPRFGKLSTWLLRFLL
jgi:hypothetical protein